jgi:arylsulfatase A-like enzyme
MFCGKANLLRKRTEYDEFVLYCDRVRQLYDFLDRQDFWNSWLVTSDHGEMFEQDQRSQHGWLQPVVRIPLMIFEPGRTTGIDIHDVTSAVDVLPTLAHLTGDKIPDWTEGVVLPPFSSTIQVPDRNIYIARAVKNDPNAALTMASTMLVRENYKLHYYFGYPEVSADGLVRLYDVKSDPEEMTDLAQSKPDVAAELLNELNLKLKEVNEPYL